MKKSKSKNEKFVPSNEILQVFESHVFQAKQLVSKLPKPENQDVFIALDCSPNGSLNAFNYGSGLKSAQIIKNLAGSFLRDELPWLENKLYSASQHEFEIDFKAGVELGLWEPLNSQNFERKLNWNQPFCVKNTKGVTKIWHPEWRRLGYKNGFTTRTGIIKFIYSGESYLQKFYMPLNTPGLPLSWRMHYRLVFLAPKQEEELEFIGGIWISRQGFKIFQEENAVIGLLSPLTVTAFF
ncbi:MAG: hypothetical protein HY931_00925 [Candidatus Falkowbacteria bacterium]|nr:MAG: hypothetical protein HY931_00925 [Candidatus Falkowbacteria bacterium]